MSRRSRVRAPPGATFRVLPRSLDSHSLLLLLMPLPGYISLRDNLCLLHARRTRFCVAHSHLALTATYYEFVLVINAAACTGASQRPVPISLNAPSRTEATMLSLTRTYKSVMQSLRMIPTRLRALYDCARK